MPEQEVEVRLPEQLLNPVTGAVIARLAPTDVLAAAIDEIKEMEGALRSHKRDIADEILRRMDHEATYTAHLGRYKVTGDSRSRTEVDGAALHAGLAPLVEHGIISQRALDAAVKTETAYKVQRAGVNALKRLSNPQIDAVIAKASSPSTKARQVNVTIEREAT